MGFAAVQSTWNPFYFLHNLESSTGNPHVKSTTYPQENSTKSTNSLGNYTVTCEGQLIGAFHRSGSGAEAPRVWSEGEGASLKRSERSWAAGPKPSGGEIVERGSEVGRSGWQQPGRSLIEDARSRSTAGVCEGIRNWPVTFGKQIRKASGAFLWDACEDRV